MLRKIPFRCLPPEDETHFHPSSSDWLKKLTVILCSDVNANRTPSGGITPCEGKSECHSVADTSQDPQTSTGSSPTTTVAATEETGT